jgi:hypothetical protein
MPANRVFVSCVSDEFEKAGSPFAGLRSDLHRYISRAKVDVRVQEYFAQSPDDTVQKLAGEVRDSAAVVHLVGEKVGAIAHPKAVAEFLAATPNFLVQHPELRAELGDCSGLSYTQWEAFLALHYGVPLFVYATEPGTKAQATHLKRLKDWRRYAAAFTGHADLFGQLIGDLHTIIKAIPSLTETLPALCEEWAADFASAEEVQQLEVVYGPDAVFDGILALWRRSDPVARARLCHAVGFSTCHRAREFLYRVRDDANGNAYASYLAASSLRGAPSTGEV